METQIKALHERVMAFVLDEPGSADPFTRRLARQNRWSFEYARRVVREYRRFLLLAVTTPHTAVPSDAVDQVWHLHLAHTTSYWLELCPEVLGRALHHHPSQGGASECGKFAEEYAKTLASYRALFDAEPPRDIWPEPARRFGKQAQHARVNVAEHWILRKPWTRVPRAGVLSVVVPIGAGVFAFAILALLVPAPHGLTPGQFSLIYVAVSLAALAMARSVKRMERHVDHARIRLDPVEIAYLAAGERRALQVALVALSTAGSVAFDAERRAWATAGPLPEDAHPFTRAVYEQIATAQTATNRELSSTFSSPATAIAQRLRDLGLLTKPGIHPALVIALVPAAAGVLKSIIESLQGEAVGHVLALCALSTVVALLGFGGHSRLCAAGERKLTELQAANQGWRAESHRASASAGVLSTVAAVWGVQVLLETEGGELGSLLSEGIADDAGDSDGGDIDGGGDGGCGGCGGCGGGCG